MFIFGLILLILFNNNVNWLFFLIRLLVLLLVGDLGSKSGSVKGLEFSLVRKLFGSLMSLMGYGILFLGLSVVGGLIVSGELSIEMMS